MSSDTDYSWWANAIAGNVGPVSDGFPECGFYRRRQKDKTFCAVAIWRDGNGDIVARETAGNHHRLQDANDIWTWVAKHPISEELYRAYCDTGTWPDMDPAVAAQVERGIGDNAPPDEIDALADQIESAKASIASYKTIGDDETLAKAQSLRARLNELSREADKKREAEKRPHFEAGKVVDTKWQPLVKGAKEAADTVAKAMNAYETAKLKRRREEERKAEEARAAAERAAREAEAAGAPPTAPEPQPAPAPAPGVTQIRGAYGKAASVRTVWIADIEDQDKVYAAFRDRPEVQALIQKLAQQAIDAGQTVPGVSAHEERKVV